MKEKAQTRDRSRVVVEAEAPKDARPIDDPARLADEARATVEKNAVEIRKQGVPVATEPPTVFRP